jgi:hypothetical protein
MLGRYTKKECTVMVRNLIPIRTYGPRRVHNRILLAINGNKGSSFEEVQENLGGDKTRSFGSSQLKYKLKVEEILNLP